MRMIGIQIIPRLIQYKESRRMCPMKITKEYTMMIRMDMMTPDGRKKTNAI